MPAIWGRKLSPHHRRHRTSSEPATCNKIPQKKRTLARARPLGHDKSKPAVRMISALKISVEPKNCFYVPNLYIMQSDVKH